MNNFEIIQKILKNNDIGFYINSIEYDNKENKYNTITLIAKINNNVEGYAEFFTNLYFNKKNGKLEKVEILE